MGKTNIVENRDAKVKHFKGILGGNDVAGGIAKVFADEAVQESFVQLDGIVGGERNLSTSQITAGVIGDAISSGVRVSADAVDSAIAVASDIAKSDFMKMDGVQSIDGSAVVASVVALNQHFIINSAIDGLDGNIADMEALTAGTKDNVAFKVYSANPVVIKGMGDIADGASITPLNAGKSMAFATRRGQLVIADAVLSYTFTAKAKATDGSGYALSRGLTSVIIGDTAISLDDYTVSAQETKPKRSVTVNDKQVTMTVDYAAGTVKIDIEAGALTVGTVLYVETALSYAKTSEIRGVVGNDIADYTYVSAPVTIGTKASLMDIRQSAQQLQYGVIASGLRTATDKISAEAQFTKVKIATDFAKLYGTGIDLSNTDGLSTTYEVYKKLTTHVDGASVTILEESGITDNVILFGGKGLVNAFNMLSQADGSGTTRDVNDANTIKYLGQLGTKYPTYYNPLNDVENPLVDSTGAINANTALNVYHTAFVIGSPADVSKRIVISGVGLPIVPVDFKISTDSVQEFGLEGKLVVSVNKDPRARKMIKKILFKTLN